MRLSKKLVLATSNRNKYEEFKALLKGYPEIQLVTLDQIVRNSDGLSRVETHSTFLENAIAKARIANKGCHYPILADDSGLEVMALEGRPGVRSHRYAPANPTLSQDQANIQLLLSEMKSAPNRAARFVCSLALVIEGVLLHATETLEGTLAESPRGTQGFGYDSIFIPAGKNKTLAECSSEEKNQISHRAQALHHLMNQINTHGLTLAKP